MRYLRPAPAENGQRPAHGLHRLAQMLRGTVGGGDQHSSDVRIVAQFLLQQGSVDAVGGLAEFYRRRDIDEQRRAVSHVTTLVEKLGQRQTRRQRVHCACNRGLTFQQQAFQALA